jgi:signal transduction histidine kinase/ActR/RegA family two-component response regulator
MAADGSDNVFTVQSALAGWLNQQTRQGLIATDTRFRVVMWNRWMEIHSGRSAAEVLGQSLFDLHPAALAHLKEYCDGALAGRVTVVSHGLHRFLLPLPPTNANLGFDEMPQSGHIGPLLEGTDVIGIVMVLEDVSDRLATEGELRKQIEAQQIARAAAETASRAKDDFLSTLSHEMRNPLNAVVGWAKVLLTHKAIDRELQERALHAIERNAAAQVTMIDDMLDMARIVAGKLRLEMQPVDLLSVVLAAVDVITPSADAKRITVRTALDPKTPRLLGDPDRLQQIVWNLLSNSLKFTEPGGSVELRLEPVGKYARVTVTDTGHGISAAFLPHVFERFQQNDASSKRRQGGLGLGLALVRELVELHGGTITASSEGEGKGASFTIDLPTMMSPEIRRNHVKSLGSQIGTSRSLADVRVLVVEDESDARDFVVTVLEQSGATVSAVRSSSEAVEAMHAAFPERLPQVVISDIGMPKEDGYDLIRQIRALPRERGGHTPAMAVTGYATRADIERALVAGYQLHLSKPMDPDALVVAVADLVRGPSARVGDDSVAR